MPQGKHLQGNCGPQKELAAGRKVTRHARVAWRKENVVRKDCSRNQVERGTPKRRKDRERLLKGPECNNGIRDQGLRQQLQGKMRIKNPGTRRHLRLNIKRTSDRINRKAGVHEESTRDVRQVAEGDRLDSVQGSAPSGARMQGSDVVEGSTPSEAEKEEALA
jgi:hypothetical protein